MAPQHTGNDVLTDREKAERHLKTWTKERLILHALNASKLSWTEKWADDYTKESNNN